MTPSRISINVQPSLPRAGHPRAWRLLGLVAGLVCLLAGTPAQARVHAARPVARPATLVAPVSAATPQPPTPGFEYVGGLGGVVTTVAISDTLAYLGQGPQLSILDMSAPAPWVPIGTLPLTTTLTDIQVVGDVAYIAGIGEVHNTRADFLILDIADPAAPELLGGYAAEPNYDPVHTVDVVGTRAYIVNGGWRSPGLRVLDVADPVAPELLGYVQQPFAGNVQVIGNRAFVGYRQGLGASGGLSIMDVSDPAAPMLLGTYPLTDSVTALQIVDDRAYLGTFASGLQILDVSDSTQPMLTGSYAAVAPSDLQIVDGIAYVAAGERGLLLLDVRDPAHPALLASYDTPGNATRLRVVGDLVYIADGPAGLHILRVRPDLFAASGTVGSAGGRFANVDGSVALTFPPGAISGTLTLSYTGALAPAPLPEDDQVALRPFALEARGDDGAPVYDLTRPYTLELTYTPAQLNAALVDEATLAVVAWDGDAWVDLLPCAGCGMDADGNRITVVADHLGTFALVGTQRRLFLPLTLR